MTQLYTDLRFDHPFGEAIGSPTSPEKVRRLLAAIPADPETIAPGVLDRLQFADQIARAEHGLRDGMIEARSSVIARLADGTLSPAEAGREIATHQAALLGEDEMRNIFRSAAQVARRTGYGLISDQGEALVSDRLRPMVAKALALAAKAAPHLEGVTSADEAIEGGPKVAQAWAQLVESHVVWVTCHALADWTRDAGLLPPTVKSDGRQKGVLIRAEHRWARPDMAPTDRRLREPDDPRVLIDHLAAVPGIYTAAEAAEHVAVIEAEELAANPPVEMRPSAASVLSPSVVRNVTDHITKNTPLDAA